MGGKVNRDTGSVQKRGKQVTVTGRKVDTGRQTCAPPSDSHLVREKSRAGQPATASQVRLATAQFQNQLAAMQG
jgi:hypothetical protein